MKALLLIKRMSSHLDSAFAGDGLSIFGPRDVWRGRSFRRDCDVDPVTLDEVQGQRGQRDQRRWQRVRRVAAHQRAGGRSTGTLSIRGLKVYNC